MPPLRTVSSSLISRIGYDAANEELWVEFHGSAKSGPVLWRYEEVKPAEYATMTASGSIGKYFLGNIKGHKPAHKES